MIYQLGEKKPRISDTSYIAPTATIIGNTEIADNASVWFNVVIRADMDKVTIGENSNIQDGSILHVDSGYPMTIANNVTVGHKVMLHGCTIGEGSLIGMNAVILNGANIGKYCLIGANALVTENMQVPDGSLVMGSPAKIVKQLDKKAQALIARGAEHYVQNGQRYKEELKLVK
ncbi:MAG: gamma carbonic anhydrase family protein [Litorilituus sp.]|nr:gamma carbonic anhydrase family protein [Litorilituus sp.]